MCESGTHVFRHPVAIFEDELLCVHSLFSCQVITYVLPMEKLRRLFEFIPFRSLVLFPEKQHIQNMTFFETISSTNGVRIFEI